MSVGHRRNKNDEDWLWSDEELDQCEKYLDEEMKLVTGKYDIPYTAGYSKDGKTVYIDKEVPQFIRVRKRGSRLKLIDVDIWKTFAFHEATEKSLEAEPYFIPYQLAHQCALRLERAYVESLGADWDDYNTKTMQIVEHVYNRKAFLNVPEDLDMEPMQDEDDNEVMEKIKNV